MTDQNLLDALALADEDSRVERAERIEWLSQYIPATGVVAGEITSMRMLEEARICFVHAHFVAAILLATSFIEHILSGELSGIGASLQELRSLESMIKSARSRLSLSSDLLDKTDRLRELRNPFTHRKATGHPHAFGTRFLARKQHPSIILEEDAKLAIQTMCKWFELTLRPASWRDLGRN